jgi:hypothetical protein
MEMLVDSFAGGGGASTGMTDAGAIVKEADTIGFYSTLADARARADALNQPGA